MIYLSYRRTLTPYAREHTDEFWAWLAEREKWFYDRLPMVLETRWYYTVVGEAYALENRAAFADEAAFGSYRAALAEMKKDPRWESERTTQGKWWEHRSSELLTDPPVQVGLRR